MWDEGSRVYRVREIGFGLGLPIGVGFLIGWQPWVGMIAVIIVLAVAASGWLQVRREVKQFPDRGEEAKSLSPKLPLPKTGSIQDRVQLNQTYLEILIGRCWSAYWRGVPRSPGQDGK